MYERYFTTKDYGNWNPLLFQFSCPLLSIQTAVHILFNRLIHSVPMKIYPDFFIGLFLHLDVTCHTKILVHAFVTSRIDYCNGLLANAPSVWTDKLQRVLNAAARVITDTPKFDRGLTTILRDDLHWLYLPRRVSYKLCLTVYKCLHGMAPQYLPNCAGPFLTYRGAVISDLLHLVCWTSLDTSWRHTADGLFHMPARLLGTLSRPIFVQKM